MKPADEFTGEVVVHHGCRDHKMDRPLELVADAPGFTSARGFQDRVAEAAQDQGLRYPSGWIIFDKKNSLHGHAVFSKKLSAPVGVWTRGGEVRMLPLTRSPRQGQQQTRLASPNTSSNLRVTSFLIFDVQSRRLSRLNSLHHPAELFSTLEVTIFRAIHARKWRPLVKPAYIVNCLLN
jgi:hypothetical protein